MKTNKLPEPLTRAPRLDNKTHDFAKWLRSVGGKWTYQAEGGSLCCNYFFSEQGNHIATAMYDNTECTFKVLIKESLNV